MKNTADTTLEDSNEYSRKSIIDKVHTAYAQNATQGVTDLTNTFAAAIATNKTTMNTSQKTMDNNQVLADIAAMEDSTEKRSLRLLHL